MACQNGQEFSDSVNLGSNPSSPATGNADVSGVSSSPAAVEQSEISEQKRTTGRTEPGTANLIARLEKATGPDRELDLAIINVGAKHPWRWHRGDETITNDQYGPGAVGNSICSLELFTESVDDALTLIPEGWNRRFSESDTRKWWAELREGYETSYGKVAIGQAKTLPLAICAAAIYAREVSA